MSSALTDVLITTNREEKVIQEMGTIMIAGIGSIFTLIADRTVISNHSFPKDTHFFTKTGLSRLSYSLKGLEDFYNGEIPSEKASSFPYAVSPEEENDFKMAFVAKSTSAAPTYFPRSILYEKRLLDGGLLQNNPAVPCVLSALEKHHRNNLFMVSLGTGELSDKKLSYGDPLSFWFDLTQPSERTEDLLEDILPIGGYHRFQYRFTTTPPDLDEVGAIQDLVEKGKELVEEKADYLRYVCKVLAPDSI
ncbi:MAG: hypothetical protein LVR00_00500 [Rhabdochlamydiaceae bacterium]|jgi:hypothetical protein